MSNDVNLLSFRTMRNCKITSLLLLLITEFLYRGLVVIAGRSCPCDDEALCEPIGGPPVRDKEIFGFARASGSDGLGLNWTHITTIAWAKDDKLICRAHQHGVRAILASPPFDLEHDMVIPERRAEWIQDTLQLVRDKFADGVVFDNEVRKNGAEFEACALQTLRVDIMS